MKNNRVDCCCTRKRRAETSPLFERGNRIAFENDHHVFVYTTIEPHYPKRRISILRIETSTPQTTVTTYPCSVPGCIQSFTTMVECEQHFDAHHAHQCATCFKVFSTSHLLELHLLEVHDFYFQTLLEKQQASYECLVQSCRDTFSSPQTRLEHLQCHHGYPKWFRFHPVPTRHEWQLWKKKQTWMSQSPQAFRAATTTTSDDDDDDRDASGTTQQTQQDETTTSAKAKASHHSLSILCIQRRLLERRVVHVFT